MPMPLLRSRAAARPVGPLLAAPLLAAVLIGAAAPASAQTQVPFAGLDGDRTAPVELSADRLEVDQTAGTAVFSGSVSVVQGPLRLGAERVQVEYAADPATGRNRIARLTAEGEVLLVTPQDAAEAARAVYDLDAGEITLSGDVVLSQGPNALAADSLVIDLDSRTGRMEGRVRTVILPDGSR